MVFKTRAKVISGFILAIFLTVSVCAVTYFSVKKLLEKVESLSEPNDKLTRLNKLLADIYQLDKAKGIIPDENDSSEFIDYRFKIQGHIDTLKSMAKDTIEINQINAINYDVSELIGVYNGLEEVKNNLLNRNFSKEALKNIETKIKRKEELNRLQSLGRIRLQYDLKTSPPSDNTIKKDTQTKNSPPINVLTEKERQNMRDLFGLLKVNLERSDTTRLDDNSASDSMLYAVRNFVLDINNEEQQLRSKLATLETDLNKKNKALIENIQKIIQNLQNEALNESEKQNLSAYDLTFRVSILLGALIIIGVIGSSGFIYSIISEINKAQNYSDRLEEAKKRSDNLAKAKQDFLANMSHEIRNPLHAIQGFNDALLKTDLNDHQEEYVKMVGFASDTLSAIVNDILDFSKLEAGKVNIENEPFNPHKLFMSMQQFYEFKAADKNLNLEWHVDLPEDKWFLGDELRINQILNNLLSNAFKFTDRGSIKVNIQYEGKDLIFWVEDSGFGMTPEVKKNIFTKFNQGDGSITRKYGGTGLGLAIVKKLVDLQRGTIFLESAEGVGTKIKITIPTKVTEPNVERTPSVDYKYSIQGLDILVIDDDPIGLKFLKLILSSKGANVTSYNGGLDFRDNFKGGHYDLALLDIQMPEVSGYQVLQMLRKKAEYKNLPTLAITANVFAKDKEKLEDEGFDGLILKPFKEKDLMVQIAKILKLIPMDETQVDVSASTEGTSHNNFKLPYDLSDLKKFCMDDEDMLEEVVMDFYSETVQNLIDMNKALDRKDYETIRSIAHQLSSRLGQLKISSSRVARQLEEDLKVNQRENVPQLVWQITKEVDEALTVLAVDYKFAV
jgi:signal transduction histidine kinase/CheY-like chemotaxis protein/HPt (histidine-containing phosphotransfer) domain-containing protein